jgi:hypothetical protein
MDKPSSGPFCTAYLGFFNRLSHFLRLTTQFFQMATRRTLALLDESQKVKRLTGNLRHMEEMRTIGGMRVFKQEHHKPPQLDTLKEANSEKWSPVIIYFPSCNAMPNISASSAVIFTRYWVISGRIRPFRYSPSPLITPLVLAPAIII